MADETESQNLVHVKVDATGVDVGIGKDFPNLLGRLLPAKFHIRRSVDQAIARTILDKVSSSEALDDAEMAFAESIVSDQALKYIRLKRVDSRARDLIGEAGVPLIGQRVDSASPPTANTSDDWVNKFREDASLVDDELVQEIYARVLAEEAQRPESFSLRTLGVLRYLDKQTATAFGDLQRVIIDNVIIPYEQVLTSCGLDHATMLTLADAGFVNSSQSEYTKGVDEGEDLLLSNSGNGRLITIRPTSEGVPAEVRLSGHVLTPAGIQLARIAECEPKEEVFRLTLNWIRTHMVGKNQILVGALPSRHWSGRTDELKWELLQ